MKAMKLFISQPMRGKSDEEILEERNNLIQKAHQICDDDIEVIDSFFQGAPADASPLWYLGEALKSLSTADAAIFSPNWSTFRGCKIEYECCEEYGIKILAD